MTCTNRVKQVYRSGLILMFLIFASACNLTNAPEQQILLTEVPLSVTVPPTRTLALTPEVPTTLPITPLTVPTTRPGQLPPTSAVLPATQVAIASTPLPVSIVILSPIPGNVVAGNVQVLGAAIHPQFLQYHLEYGPDPNPGNLWFPTTGAIQNPVLNGLLGIWNSTGVQDGLYQLRLRLILRDGTGLTTVVNNIRVQNSAPTPVPSATPNVARPIAAFTQNVASGQLPLTVRFTNQSVGTITSYRWDFGDGGSSQEASPTHTFNSTGLFNVILTVNGPGGSSNVSRQINVQSPTAPIAAFTNDKASGTSPLNVQFTDQSTGNVTSYSWNFGDGTTSTDRNPAHTFTAVGTYNVILTVTGPGGSSIVTRQITVDNPAGAATATPTSTVTSSTVPSDTPLPTDTAQPASTDTPTSVPPVAAFTALPTSGTAPLPIQFTDTSTGDVVAWAWDFGDGGTSSDQHPSYTFNSPGDWLVTLNVTGADGSVSSAQTTVSVSQAAPPLTAAFTADPTSGTAPLPVQFTNTSTGDVVAWAWDFGDGGTSSDQHPSYTFNSPGDWLVTLNVTGADGSVSSAQTTVSVSQATPPLTAAFTADPTSGTAPLPIQFTDTSTGDVIAWAWDFGDGGTSSDQHPSYTFNSPGDWLVTLTITGSDGVTMSNAEVTISVNPAGPPPDSSHIVFSSDRDGRPQIYIMNADGSNLARLSDTSADDYAPAWSPNGSQIVFVSERDGRPQIYTMNADGSNLARLSDTSADDYAPAWSPNGSRITFVSERDGNSEIYVMNSDGTGIFRLTNDGADDTHPGWTS